MPLNDKIRVVVWVGNWNVCFDKQNVHNDFGSFSNICIPGLEARRSSELLATQVFFEAAVAPKNSKFQKLFERIYIVGSFWDSSQAFSIIPSDSSILTSSIILCKICFLVKTKLKVSLPSRRNGNLEHCTLYTYNWVKLSVHFLFRNFCCNLHFFNKENYFDHFLT